MSALVGVIGGAGPAATARFSALLVARADARRDQDHVRTLVLNDASLPDRTAFLLGASDVSPAPRLAADARLLADAGCALLAMPCNTAHAFADDIRRAAGVPLVSMVDAAADACRGAGLRQVGVLATAGTVACGLYERALAARGIGCAYPDEALQARVTALIYDEAKAGRALDPCAVAYLCGTMAARGCDGVLLGCTELSCDLPAAGAALPVPVVDALAVLADRVIEAAGCRTRAGAAALPPVAAPAGAAPAAPAAARPDARRERARRAPASRRMAGREAPCAAS